MKRFIIMDKGDNVATAMEHTAKGDEVAVFTADNVLLHSLRATETIAFGHKIALRPLAPGHHVLKYGADMGECVLPVPAGALVHVHNVKSLSVDIPHAFKQEIMRQMGMEGVLA